MYKFKQDLAMAYFDGCSKKTASRLLAREINLTPGLTGRSYAIPTMQGGTDTIRPYVDEFVAFAQGHPELRFLVTRIGCGIAGFRDEEIAPLFRQALSVPNIYLPEEFYRILSGPAATL